MAEKIKTKDPDIGVAEIKGADGNWQIIMFLASAMTVFTFWGMVTYFIVEYAADRSINTSTVYVFLFVFFLGSLFGLYLFYNSFIKRTMIPEAVPRELNSFKSRKKT